MTWPGAKKQANLSVVEHKGNQVVTDDKSGEWVQIAAFECRGMEVVAWHPAENGDFTAESTGGKVFEEVDLSEGDWTDYDDDNDLAVSVMELDSKIEVVK